MSVLLEINSQENTASNLAQDLTGNTAKWQLLEADSRSVMSIMQRFNLPEIVARVIAIRFKDVANSEFLDKVAAFIDPKLKTSMPDPMHFKDMEKAVLRVMQALDCKEKIVIFGDYDVDGATSSALLTRFLKASGADVIIYIPDRIEEGYGPSVAAMQYLANSGFKLCITVDCGTAAFEPILAAKNLGMDVVVIDHHLSAEILPEALAVVNPNRLDEVTEYRYLAAVGMCFMFVVAINTKLKLLDWYKNNNIAEVNLLDLLDIVALGTVADVVPLVGINRALVAQGLKIIRKRANVGLAALADIAGIDSQISAYHLGFVLGPRINAGGRVGKSDLGARLLSSDNIDEVKKIAIELNKLNEERRAIEQFVTEAAILQVEQAGFDKPFIFAVGNNWHPGVIGIVASRLKDKYQKPVAVISVTKGVGSASVRSINGVDVGAAIISAKNENLLIKGGGHAMAAGFTVAEENIIVLQQYLSFRLEKSIAANQNRLLKVFGFLSVSSLNANLARSLQSIEPYGMGNSEPIFVLKDLLLHKVEVVAATHIRCIAIDTQTGASVKAMAFRSMMTDLGEFLLKSAGKKVNLAGKVRLNSWQGYEKAEFYIEDASV